MQSLYIYNYPIGNLAIAANETAITRITFSNEIDLSNYNIIETPIIKEAAKQLNQYFNKERTSFDLPLYLEGTKFQKDCWNALISIPYGTTCSYLEQAHLINNPKACRAVGNANNKNPIMIVIPCHRVVGSNGIGGFRSGIDNKMLLLQLERDA